MWNSSRYLQGRLLLLALFLPGMCVCDAANDARTRWYAGAWDSTLYLRAEHPRTIAIRMELQDKDTRLPVRGVRVSLEGEYWETWISQKIIDARNYPGWDILVDPDKREPQLREFRLDAVSGSDGMVVFSLGWQKEYPWDSRVGDKWTYSIGDEWIIFFDDIEKVQRLEIRHPRYRYVEAPLDFKHIVGLKQYIDPKRDNPDEHELFDKNWKGEINRKNVKLFVLNLDQSFPDFKKKSSERVEFFEKVRAKDYGLVYRDADKLPNMGAATKCGPYFVYDLGEILLERVAQQLEISGRGNILTGDADDSEPWYSQNSQDAGTTEGSHVLERTGLEGGQRPEHPAQEQQDAANIVKPAGRLDEYRAIAEDDPLGIAVERLTIQEFQEKWGFPQVLARNFLVHSSLIVRYVVSGSPADEAGLTIDTFIDSVEQNELLLKSAADYRRFLNNERVKKAKTIEMTCWQFPAGYRYKTDDDLYRLYYKEIIVRKGESSSVDAEATSGQPEDTEPLGGLSDQEKDILKTEGKKISEAISALPSIDELREDPTKLMQVWKSAQKVKQDVTIAAIRAIPIKDPETGEMTTFGQFSQKIAEEAGFDGQFADDPVATTYLMLFDKNFLLTKAPLVKTPDGSYVSLTDAIANSADQSDSESLKQVVEGITQAHHAYEQGQLRLALGALSGVLSGVSQRNKALAIQAGAKQKTIDLGDGVTMEFVLIPAGSFDMGSPSSERNRHDDEGPVHRVTVSKGFWMGQTEVTRGQFAAFALEGRYKTDAEKEGWAYAWNGTSWGKVEGASWRNPGFNQGDTHPVVCVSWNDAKAFCDWLSRKEGRSYRLPSEGEWEYACRAGTDTAYQWGDSPDGGGGWCNYADLTLRDRLSWSGVANVRDGYVHTAPVAQFSANAFGLYDMHGNVWEWCNDWYDKNYYSSSPEVDPQGPSSGVYRVVRGGSWSTFRGTAVQRIATGTRLTSGTSSSDFVLSWTRISPLLFYPLVLCLIRAKRGLNLFLHFRI